jgi:hypothetical protein
MNWRGQREIYWVVGVTVIAIALVLVLAYVLG